MEGEEKKELFVEDNFGGMAINVSEKGEMETKQISRNECAAQIDGLPCALQHG